MHAILYFKLLCSFMPLFPIIKKCKYSFCHSVHFSQILFSSLYATIVFFLTDQLFEVDRFVKVVIVYIVVTNVADGLGLILGASLDPIVSDEYTFCLYAEYSVQFMSEIYKKQCKFYRLHVSNNTFTTKHRYSKALWCWSMFINVVCN